MEWFFLTLANLVLLFCSPKIFEDINIDLVPNLSRDVDLSAKATFDISKAMRNELTTSNFTKKVQYTVRDIMTDSCVLIKESSPIKI